MVQPYHPTPVIFVRIGLVTALVADLAGLLGCVVGMGDAITAITLVALGTSLPDTFASKSAAQQDPYADASIGNITGSNSVNVFLGLGLPGAQRVRIYGRSLWYIYGVDVDVLMWIFYIGYDIYAIWYIL